MSALEGRNGTRPTAGNHVRLINGKSIVEWANDNDMNPKTLTSRLARNGGDLEAALATAVRHRADDEEMEARYSAEIKFILDMRPVTVRQTLYHMEVFYPHLIGKDNYKMVAADLAFLRESGRVDYEDIIDNTRRVIRGYAYNSVRDALEKLVRNYRKNVWADWDCLVQIWIEKDALAGVLEDTAVEYNVPLMVARGWSSLSFLHTEALSFKYEDRPIYIYHLGDFDADGRGACDEIEEKLGKFAPDADIRFKRLALATSKQVRDLKLPTRAPNPNSSRAKAWGSTRCAELDAIPPDILRKLVEGAINNHMSRDDLERLEVSDPNLDKVRRLIKRL